MVGKIFEKPCVAFDPSLVCRRELARWVSRAALLTGMWLVCVQQVAADDRQRASTVSACVMAATEGQTIRDEGRLLSAREQFLRCARAECHALIRHSCAEWLDDLDERIPSAVVTVQDAMGQDIGDARVYLDGVEVPLDGRPRPLDPGQHTVSVMVGEAEPMEREFLLVEGDKARLLTVRLPAVAEKSVEMHEAVSEVPREEATALGSDVHSSDRASIPAGVWMLGGVGTAALLTSGALWLVALRDFNAYKAACAAGDERTGCRDRDEKRGVRVARSGDGLFGVGLAALAGATTWGALAWSRSRDGSLAALSVLPTRAGFWAGWSGRF